MPLQNTRQESQFGFTFKYNKSKNNQEGAVCCKEGSSFLHLKKNVVYFPSSSESSMFVSKRRFILKTCGTTLLLQALVPLLELAREYCGFDAIEVLFIYIHKHQNPNNFCPFFLSFFLLSPVSDALSVGSFQNFFYSRKNFMKPTHQEFPHRNFQEEVDFLIEIFPST